METAWTSRELIKICWWVDVIDCLKGQLWPTKVIQKAVPDSTRSRTPMASGYIFLHLENTFKFK